jgi:tetratricopeptide (TPR) repeat protein
MRPDAVRSDRWLADRVLLVILAAALAVRLGVVLWLSDTVPYSDAAYYHLAAQKMAADWHFAFDRSQVEYFGKLGWWPPLYPASLSLLYRLVGDSARAAVFVQALLGTLVVALVYGVARRAAGVRTARVAAALVALDPTYIFLTNILASENLYVLWLVLGLWWSGRAWTSAGRRPAVLAGLALGLGALTRAIGLAVPVVLALFARPHVASRRAWLVTSAWLLGTTALTIAPWTVRNALVAGSPALVCFGGGLNFYYGHNLESTGYRPLEQTPMATLHTQADIDRTGYRLGFACLAQAPFGFVTRGAEKIGALFGAAGYAPHASSAILLPDGWQTDPEAGARAAALRARQRAKNVYLDGVFTWLATVHTWILLAGAALACVRWRRMPAELRLAAWLCVAWIAAHVVFWAQPRFRYPMEIPLALLAAWTFASLWKARPGSASAVTRAHRGGAALALVALLGTGCAAPPASIPPLEQWGHTQQPYDDPIEVAAMNALGPRPAEYEALDPPAIRLGDFLLLERHLREGRTGMAEDLVSQGDTWRRMSGVDSLPPYLEAIRVDPSYATAYLRAAQIALMRGMVLRAHALAAQGLRLDARNAALWVALSESYQREGDPERARQALEYALAIDPKLDASAYQALASHYLRTGNLARADSLLLHAPPGSSAGLRAYLTGVRARLAGEPEAARRDFADAAHDSSAAVGVLVDWGNAEYETGHLDAATHAYQRALRRDPAAAAALNGLGIVQRAQGDLDGAARTFQRLAAVRPQDGAAHFNLAGTSLEAAQRAPRGARADSLLRVADAAFAACADLGYRVPESRLRRAEIHLRLNEPAPAYQEAHALIGDPAQGAAARLIAGRAALLGNRPQDAVMVLAPAFRADSLGVDGMGILGKAYLQLSMPQYAARVLRRAHERAPEDWKTSVNLGVALSESGELVAAETLLRPLATRYPDQPEVLQNLAAVLQRRGQRDEAEALMRRVRALQNR